MLHRKEISHPPQRKGPHSECSLPSKVNLPLFSPCNVDTIYFLSFIVLECSIIILFFYLIYHLRDVHLILCKTYSKLVACLSRDWTKSPQGSSIQQLGTNICSETTPTEKLMIYSFLQITNLLPCELFQNKLKNHPILSQIHIENAHQAKLCKYSNQFDANV